LVSGIFLLVVVDDVDDDDDDDDDGGGGNNVDDDNDEYNGDGDIDTYDERDFVFISIYLFLFSKVNYVDYPLEQL